MWGVRPRGPGPVSSSGWPLEESPPPEAPWATGAPRGRCSPARVPCGRSLRRGGASRSQRRWCLSATPSRRRRLAVAQSPMASLSRHRRGEGSQRRGTRTRHAEDDERDVHDDADSDPGGGPDSGVDAGGAVRSAPACVWKSTSELSAVTPSGPGAKFDLHTGSHPSQSE